MSANTNPSAAAAPTPIGVTVPDVGDEADNLGPIQQAMDDVAGAGGGVVVLPSGRWPISAPVQLRDNVTLRGPGMLVTTICPFDDTTAPQLIEATAGLAGATVEDLWLDGHPTADPDHSSRPVGDGAAIDITGGATFCVLRRIRMTDLPSGAIRLAGPDLNHLYLEQLVIEGCGGDGVVFAPSDQSTAVFLTELSIRGFGRASTGHAGVRLGGRAFISQLHVDLITEGQIGLKFEAGSDYTVTSNVYFGLDGGRARDQPAIVGRVRVEAEVVRDRRDATRERVFP